MQHHLIKCGDHLIFDRVEVAVVAVSACLVAIFLIPCAILHAQVFCWHKLGIEPETVLLVGLFVLVKNNLQDPLQKRFVLRIVVSPNPH
ncbi:hypothetical protein D3C86_2116050 [compost metagenome]